MEAIDNLRQVKNNWHKCSIWELEQQKNDACLDELKHKINPSDKDKFSFQNKGKTLINSINILDQLGINKSENALVSVNAAMSLVMKALGVLGYTIGYVYSKRKNSPNSTPKMAGFIGLNIAFLIGGVVKKFISSYFAKTATRVARYQTRNNELKDVRNFVTYTDEQIEEAKKKLPSMHDVKDITDDMSVKESANPIKVYKKSLKAVKILKKDYAEYKKWHDKYLQDEINTKNKLKAINLTETQKTQAEKDKNFILQTIRKLELSSNKYELNTSFTMTTLAVLMQIIAIGGGFVLCWGFGKSAKNRTRMLNKSLDILSKLSIPTGIVGMIMMSGPLLKIAKESAKLGRFKESEKLLENEKNFYTYTDKDIEDIRKKHNKIHKNKSIIEIIKDDFKFIPQLKANYQEYLKYKKEKQPNELKLAEILKTIPISQEQLEDAKKLQKQTFMAFEKIDDKSECLVDDTTAAVSSISGMINATVNCISKIVTLTLFGKEISQLTKNGKMPGFFEGLKLARNLSFKKMVLIFIVPYLISRATIILTSLIGTEIKKKACKIGIMSATEELNNPKRFI